MLLSQGSRIGRGDHGNVPKSVVKGWLRAHWLAVVDIKNHKGDVHEDLNRIFTSVGAGGCKVPRFLVCFAALCA